MRKLTGFTKAPSRTKHVTKQEQFRLLYYPDLTILRVHAFHYHDFLLPIK